MSVRPPRLVALLFSLAAVTAAPSAVAHAEVRTPAVPTVLQDDAVFLHGTDDRVRSALQQAKDLGVERIRLTAGWSVIAPRPADPEPPVGFDATDPAAYPFHAWDRLDRAVRLSAEIGLRPMIDVGFWAPRWATGAQETDAHRLRTDVDPERFAAFATAVARRYAGGYAPPAAPSDGSEEQAPPPAFLDRLLGKEARRPAEAPGQAEVAEPLPKVDLITLWNEPNHPGFLLPQWSREGGDRPESPARYRAMVHAAYPAVKAVAPDMTVLIGGTSSMGSSVPGRSGVPPLRFLRELACVDRRLRPITGGACADFRPVPGDGWSHHPYSLRTMPDARPRDPDLAPVARTKELRDLLVALAAQGRVTARTADLYLTEYGYETDPDPRAIVTVADQARMLSWAEWLGTRVKGVKMWPQFLLEDRPGDPAGPRMRPFGDWQTGLLYADGTAKPAAATFRTPTYARCAASGGRRWSMLWGRLRGAAAGSVARAEVEIGGGWRPVAIRSRPSQVTAAAASAGSARNGQAVTAWIPATRAPLRLVWRGRDGSEISGPGVRSGACAKPPRPRAAAAPRSRPGRTPRAVRSGR